MRKRLYSHGQKSREKFAFAWHFFKSQGLILRLFPIPQQDWTLMYPEVSTLYRVGERELQDIFENDALFYEGTHKLQEILNTASLLSGIVVLKVLKTGSQHVFIHRAPTQSVCLANCYFIVNVPDLPFALPIAIYR